MDYTVNNLQIEDEVLCVSGLVGYVKVFMKIVEKEGSKDA